MRLECTGCFLQIESDVPELLESWRKAHNHSCVPAPNAMQAVVPPTPPSFDDEFGEIFKDEKPALSLVEKLDAQDEKDRQEFLNKVAPHLMESVNHPAHYNQTSVECIQIIEELNLNFNLGNALKYLWRCESKGKKREDLEKCIWYLRRELNHDNDRQP